MSLVLLEMPDSTQERISWLEQEMVGSRLNDLVAQLKVMGTGLEKGPPATLADLLGASRQNILETGFSGLREEQLSSLLAHPELLLELQELLLMEGGDYWIDLCNHGESPNVLPQVVESTSDPIAPASLQPEESLTSSQHSGTSGFPLSWISTAVAAVLLIAAGWWFGFGNASPGGGWGFDDLSVVAKADGAGDYLNSLADAANDWFNVELTDQDSTVSRLNQFSHGCDNLLAADHRPLNDEQKTWLTDKCRDWKQKIDDLSRRLAASEIEYLSAKQSADDLINKMISALRTKAAEA